MTKIWKLLKNSPAAFLLVLLGAVALGAAVFSGYSLVTPDGADSVLILDVSDTTDSASGSTKRALLSALPASTPVTSLLALKQNADTAATDVELTAHASAADPHPNYLQESIFDAYSVLYATTDNTPARLTVVEQSVVGRATGGAIMAIPIDNDLAATSDADDTLPSSKATKAYTDSHSANTDVHIGTCTPAYGDCGAGLTCNTLAVAAWPEPSLDGEIRCLDTAGAITYYRWSGLAWTEIGSGSFSFDTYPTYEDSAHSSGIAVNATTLAVYSTAASKWMTVTVTDTLDAGPTPTPTPTPEAFSATDSFDREDSNILGTLSGGTYTWTEAIGDMDIESNRAGLGTVGTAVAVIAVTRTEGFVQSDVNAEGSASSQMMVVFWWVNSSNYWYVCVDPDSADADDLELHQVADGTDTELADGTLVAGVNTTYEIKVTYSSSAVVVDLDASEAINYSGAITGNSGYVGIGQYRSGSATGWNNNFVAGD